MNNKHLIRLGVALVLAGAAAICGVKADAAAKVKCATGIEKVTVLGKVGMDGSKPYAIVAHYNGIIQGAKLTPEMFEVTNYGTSLGERDINAGVNPGKVTKVYVNSKPEVSNSPSGKGCYVVFELNTDYSAGRYARSWLATMVASVKQLTNITTSRGVIKPSAEAVSNSHEFEYVGINPQDGSKRKPERYIYANEGTYTIEGIEQYQLHMIDKDAEAYKARGIEVAKAFRATHCFDEANGKYWDFDLPYALYVPQDYDPAKQYALVLHIHDAGSMDTNPMLTLCEGQGPANYASERFQNLFKSQGLGGAIVVCPAISETYYMDAEHPSYNLRISRDNWTLSCAAPAIWQLLDELTSTYSVSADRIYGSGQSMGGMTVLAMASQRDNYFAGLLPLSCKWGQNFNKEVVFAGQRYYNAEADGRIIWKTDAHGNPADYNNWMYMISDDNILFLCTVGENYEYQLMYNDLAGVEVKSADLVLDAGSITAEGVESRNRLVSELVAPSADYPLGIYQVNLMGNVSHMSAWFYGHSTFAAYEWLSKQTRQSEMKRAKLPLNKPFVRAEEQLTDEAHIYSRDRDGNTVYFPTGKRGSGTLGYNSACSALGSRERLNPGWRTQEQILSQWVDKQTWVDPVRDVANGCEYLLYPTTQRGEGTEGSCMVYLPKGYHESNLRYPVIYYLHGGTGNQREGRWMIARIDSAIANGSMKPAIVVCPHAMPIGWYVNGNMSDPKVTTGPIEDVLIKDLIPFIDRHYRTIATREARGIEGFSMGGCGAMRLAMKYPELFGAASSVAGAVVAWNEEPLKRALECTFGDVDNPASRKYFEANQPEVFAKKNAKKIGKLGVNIRIFVGTNDRLYDENGNHIIPRFSQYLNKLKIKHSLTIIPDAGHNPSEMFDANHLPYDVTFWNTLSTAD
ncbi:MAG: alpha/beta hydrolase-fold protein [Muribaculaceae bacterium]